jgi:hypothetical protein
MIQPRGYRDVHVHWQRNGRHPMPKIKKARGFVIPGLRSLLRCQEPD